MKKFLLRVLEYTLAGAARIYITRTKPTVIWVTGSVGKTSCRMILSQIAQKYLNDKRVYTSSKNFNSELWLVFSIFQIEEYSPWIKNLLLLTVQIIFKALKAKKEYDVIVLEYGIDHPGDMEFLLKIAIPDYAIFTKLDKIHSCYFDTPGGIGEEKIKLLQAAKKHVYLNPKDDFLRTKYDELTQDKSYFSDITRYAIQKDQDKINVSFEVGGIQYTTNISGEENAVYIALWFDILHDMGYELSGKNREINLELQAGRFSFFAGKNGSILIDSTYNAGPESMKKMIENTFELKKQAFSDYKIVLVLWEMRELWKSSEHEHRKLAKIIEESDEIFLIGASMLYLKDELEKNGFFSQHSMSSQLIGKELCELLDNTSDKYLILFKGSQNTIFVEEALKEVLENQDNSIDLVRQSDDWMKKKQLFFSKN